MKRDEINSKSDYEPYLIPTWIYVVIFLVLTPMVLLLGWEFGR
jgi:hypothetical protein